MKMIKGLLFTIPSLLFSSHSVETGLFYSIHHETGYCYKLGGIQINYEIGNSKGLKAQGKVRFSNDSDLLFFQANSEILYYIPFKSIEIVPFIGVQLVNHIVYQNEGDFGILNRSYFPFGVGGVWKVGDLVLRAKIGHMQSISHSFIVEAGDEFIGKKLWNKNAYLAELKIGYQLSDRAIAFFSSTWNQSYRGSLKHWTNELTAQYNF